jgi:hypothetical protein
MSFKKALTLLHYRRNTNTIKIVRVFFQENQPFRLLSPISRAPIFVAGIFIYLNTDLGEINCEISNINKICKVIQALFTGTSIHTEGIKIAHVFFLRSAERV